MIKTNIPTLELFKEKIQEKCDANELYTIIGQSLTQLNFKPFSEYTKEDLKFVEDLYRIIMATAQYDHSPSFYPQIDQLFQEVLNLSIATNLNPHVISSLMAFFFINQEKVKPMQSPTAENCYDFEKGFVNFDSKILRPGVSGINEKLINSMFKTSVLQTAIAKINNKSFTLDQMSSFLMLYTKFQPFLDEKLASSLCFFLAKNALSFIAKDVIDSNALQKILIFFTTFFPQLSFMRDEFFDFLKLLIHSKTPSQLLALKVINSLIRNSKNPCDFQDFKREVLLALEESSLKNFIKYVYESFVPLFLKVSSFNVDDLIPLISHVQTMPNEVANCFFEILKTLPEDVSLDNITCRALSHGMNNPTLGLALVSRTNDPSLSKTAFIALINNFDENLFIPNENVKLDEKIMKFIFDDLCQAQGEINLERLGHFLIAFPKWNIIFEYIMKITDSPEFEKYEPILKKLAGISNRFDGEKGLLNLFNSVMDEFIAKNYTPQISHLSKIIINWITNFQSIPDGQMMSKIQNLDFSKFPDELPQIISAIMSRAPNRRSTRQFIFKMMKDTVPKRHAFWAMNLAFNFVHDEKKDIEKIGEHLFQALSDNSKKSNAIFMIYQGILIEADFYNIGIKKNGIEINALINGMPFSFVIHQLHSARRIYLEVSKFVHKSVYEFVLYNKGKKISICSPLSSIQFSISKELKLKCVFEENIDGDFCRTFLQPHFIEYFQRPEKFATLFNHMNSFNSENEAIFLLLNLIDDDSMKPVPSSPIQSIFKKDCFISVSDIESYRLFPFIIEAALGSNSTNACSSSHVVNTSFSSDYISSCFQVLLSYNFDHVSTLMACKLLANYAADNCRIGYTLIKNCLIESRSPYIREAMRLILSKTSEENKILSLLSYTTFKDFRNRTKEYFNLIHHYIENEKMSANCLNPLLIDIKPYEIEFEGPVDETLCGILKLIPITSDNLNIVLNMIFSVPTLQTPNRPFLQTIKSKKAAINFLLRYENSTEIINYLQAIIKQIPETLEYTIQLSDNLSRRNRGILYPTNLQSSILMSLFTIKPFRNYIINGKFKSLVLNDLSILFTEMMFGSSRHVNLKNYQHLSCEKTIPDLLSSILNRLDYDQRLSSSLFSTLKIQVESDKCNFNDYINHIESPWILITIDRLGPYYFPFPLFFKSYKLMSVIVISDEKRYSIVYREKSSNGFQIKNTKKSKLNSEKICGDTWYIIQDGSVRHYDVSNLPELCYGGSKSNCFAFFLIYSNNSLKSPKIKVNDIDSAVKEKIQQHSNMQWPGVICRSHQFIKLVSIFIQRCPEQSIDLAFEALFKIAVFDEDEINHWLDLFTTKIFVNNENCQKFVNYFITFGQVSSESSKEINNHFLTLTNISCISASASNYLPIFFSNALKNMNHLPNVINFLKAFEFTSNPLQFGFICDIISALITNGLNNYDAFRFILTLLTNGKTNVNIDSIFDRVFKCFDLYMRKISKLIGGKEFYEIYTDIMQPEFFEFWDDILTQSKGFKIFLKLLSSNHPEFLTLPFSDKFQNIIASALQYQEEEENIDEKLDGNDIKGSENHQNSYESASYERQIHKNSPLKYQSKFQNDQKNKIKDDFKLDTKEYDNSTSNQNYQHPEQLSIIQSKSEQLTEFETKLNSTILPAINKLIFSPNIEIRHEVYDSILKILPHPDQSIIKFIDQAIIDHTIKKPDVEYTSSFMEVLLSYINKLTRVGQINDEILNYDFYFQLVEKLCYICPGSVSVHYDHFFDLIDQINDISQTQSINEKIDDSYKNIIYSIMLIIHHILAYDISIKQHTSDVIVHKILNTKFGCSYGIQLLKLFNKNDGGILCSSCIEYCLNHVYDDNTEIMVGLINDGIKYDLSSLIIPHKVVDMMNLKLANALWHHSHTEDIFEYIKKSLDLAVSIEFFKLCPYVQEALNIVENHS